ncbi:hypothetical protein [Geitlerinema sp. PCC 9228]|nr:hypothetical protein [Geitlerinema sp. PCC 9228]
MRFLIASSVAAVVVFVILSFSAIANYVCRNTAQKKEGDNLPL